MTSNFELISAFNKNTDKANYNLDVARKFVEYLSKNSYLDPIAKLKTIKEFNKEAYDAWCEEFFTDSDWVDTYEYILKDLPNAFEQRTTSWIESVTRGLDKWLNSPICTSRYDAPLYWFPYQEVNEYMSKVEFTVYQNTHYPLTYEIIKLIYDSIKGA